MLGEPKYRNGDKVSFEIDDRVWEGNVCIVDAYGTFEYLEDVSYDIMVDIGPKGGRTLFKHIPESNIKSML